MLDMLVRLSAVVITASNPSPQPNVGPDGDNVTPGVVGFLATLFIALGAVALIFDMIRRIRRMRYREEIATKLDQEQNEAVAGASTDNVEGQR